jgi:hypothetical protein
VCAIFHQTSEARIRLYSRALAEKWVTDSLKRVDSLRVVDSTRVADSMFIARYKSADTTIVNEKLLKDKEMEKYKRVDVDSSLVIVPDKNEDISTNIIEIDESNPQYAKIDSIQNRIDSINNSLHDTDPWFSKMKLSHISEKRRYLNYLLTNHYKDSAAVCTYCTQLYQLYMARLDMLITIRDSQVNNSKSLMAGPIEEQRLRIGELSNYLFAISPKVPLNLVPVGQDTIVDK